MAIETIQKEIQTLPDNDFYELLRWLPTEERRRIDKVQQEAGKAQVVEELRKSGDIKSPTKTKLKDLEKGSTTTTIPEWRDPGTDHSKMYLPGDVVEHNGKIWVSTTQNLNSWEPGGEGVYDNVWKQVPTTPGVTTPKPSTGTTSIPEWKPETSYKRGDKVSFQGKTYQLLQDHVSKDYWRPGAGTDSIYKAV